MDTVPEFSIKTGSAYENIVVPSIDSVRQSFISAKLIEGCGGLHVLCPGPTGTGKSVNLSLYLQKNAPSNYLSVFINFSAQTHVNQLQDLIDSKVEKRLRGVVGPPAGRKMVLFVDDLNMPQKEFYGAQPPLELLRQWLDHRGWYNRKELTYFQIVDIVMVSAMGPPGGGRSFISPRIKRHYNFVAYADFQETSITTMFTTIASFFLGQFSEEVVGQTIPSMIREINGLFTDALETLLPTPAKCHYLFNLRDIWKVFLGVCALKARTSGAKESVARCFVHEIQRVFGDRLTDDADRQWLRGQLEQRLDNMASSTTSSSPASASSSGRT
jgi:dynein heavy chain